jgi:hypothetical protein
MTLMKIAESFGVNEDGLLAGVGPQARRRGRNNPQGVRAAKLLEAAWSGNAMAPHVVNEALSTSDLFKSATGDVLDAEMLAQYQAMPKQWDKFAARTTVRNFKPKQLRELSGGRLRFERVPELTEYPSADYSVAERSIQVGKYGRRFGYSFEAQVNDELDELAQVPGEFANSAILTEDYVSLQQLVNPLTGAPNTAFFKAGNGNIGTGAMTQANVQAAITLVSTKKDAQGNLLYPGPLQLVYGPANAFIADVLLNTAEVRNVSGNQTTVGPNPLRGKITGTLLDNLPGGAWFILPLPSAPRPAFYTAFLRGWETPDLRYKNDQGKAVGGGDIAPEEGDFDVDAIYWRARHIVGAAQGDPMFTYASDGAG